MSARQRKHRLRLRQAEARRARTRSRTATTATVTGTLLATTVAAVAGLPVTASATVVDTGSGEVSVVGGGARGMDELTAFRGGILFAASDADRGYELWFSDGTPNGTRVVRDIEPGPDSSYPSAITVVDGRAFFVASTANGTTLWVTDGSEAGTREVADVEPSTYNPFEPPQMTALGDALFFVAEDAQGRSQLWTSDGVDTHIVATVASQAGYLSGVKNPTPLGDKVYFVVNDGQHGDELWSSDGTESGTSLVADVEPGPRGSLPRSLMTTDDKLFFDPDPGDGTGAELWVTDGNGASLVRDIDPRPGASSYPTEVAAVEGDLFFTAYDGNARELWRSDGTTAGTTRVVDGYGDALSSVGDAVAADDALFVEATDVTGARAVWRVDGGSTVAEPIPGTFPLQSMEELTVVDDSLYFAGTEENSGTELWRVDIVTGETGLVSDIGRGAPVYGPPPASSDPRNSTAAGGTLFFIADDGDGAELFRTGSAFGPTSNTSSPQISGQTRVGSPLTATPGQWTPASGLTFAYQWLVDGVPIAGATSAGYVPTAGDFGRRLTVEVTSVQPGFGRTTAVSAPTDQISPAGVANVTPPTISGDPRVGSTLTASTGQWSPSDGLSFTYQWLADGVPVAGATAATFTPTVDQADARMTVRVTADRAQTSSGTAESRPTAPVVLDAVANRAAPVVSGEPRVGSTLLAGTGTWSPSEGLTYAYQWYAGGDAIAGATAASFTPSEAQLGDALSVAVTASRDDLAPSTARSEPTAPVSAAAITNTGAPTFTGRVQVGGVLVATPGTWSPAAGLSYSYAWYAEGVAEPVATTRRFQVPASLAGSRVALVVTASRSGLESGSAASAPSSEITRGELRLRREPEVRGRLVPGKDVRVGGGRVTPRPDEVRYQWLRDGKAIPDQREARYTMRPRDIGTEIAVRVVYVRAGYERLVVTTEPVLVRN